MIQTPPIFDSRGLGREGSLIYIPLGMLTEPWIITRMSTKFTTWFVIQVSCDTSRIETLLVLVRSPAPLSTLTRGEYPQAEASSIAWYLRAGLQLLRRWY